MTKRYGTGILLGTTRSRYREISDGKNGLFVILLPAGRNSFAVRYRFNGRSRKLTLDPRIMLVAARKAAAARFSNRTAQTSAYRAFVDFMLT